jgi:hypothetical protein
MIHRFLHPFRRQREGQTLAVVAVMMVALLALLSLGIDMGMAYTARAEAQRVADAAALAGASAFLDFVNPADAVGTARQRAEEYAELNFVRNRRVVAEEPEVLVWVIPDSQKVRVRIERSELPVWFARFLGRDDLTVSARAAAWAAAAGSSDCAAPFSIPDLWDEKRQDTLSTHGAYPNNLIMNFYTVNPLYRGNADRNPNEFWTYDPADPVLPDVYRPYNDVRDLDGNLVYDKQGQPMLGAGPDGSTGYGSNRRHAIGEAGPQDNGLRVLLYPPQHVPGDQANNWWNFWAHPDSSASYNRARQMLKQGECIDISDRTGVGGTLKLVPGNRAVVVDDWYDLIDNHDKDLVWSEDLRWPVHPSAPDVPVKTSRRIVSVPIVHPDVLLGSASERELRVVDIATMFLEDPRKVFGAGTGDKNFTPLTGRIIHRGAGALGPNQGVFQRVLQLIE